MIRFKKKEPHPGPTMMRYTVFDATPGAELDNGATVPAGVDAIVMGRRRIDGGVFETTANAYYLEDIWNVTSSLVLNLGVRELPSARIGELVMRELKKLDKVAYVRFASVYRSFEDVDEFKTVVDEIRR